MNATIKQGIVLEFVECDTVMESYIKKPVIGMIKLMAPIVLGMNMDY